MEIVTRPLTPSRWRDLEAVFAGKGCSLARGCWCMYYRRSGSQEVPKGASRAQANRDAFKALVDAGPPPGLIAYAGGMPVGWVTLGPREVFLKLARSPVMKPVDAQPVWSIVCFVVPAPYRGQGVASALLEAAVQYARKRGARLVEAYPMDRAGRVQDDWMWHGALSMFQRAGFSEVARRRPQRPIVRRALAPAARKR
jgi:GNAT superfamily N-acetyltransferase